MQPYSGSPANLAVYLAFVQPGDTVMGLGLPSGGHLTHGHSVSITGKYFKSVPYGVRADDHRIDMDQVRDARASSTARSSSGAAPRRTRARSISRRSARSPTRSARSSPRTSRTSRASSSAACTPRRSGIADVVTTTTHKTFRGPRGGMIMCKEEHAQAIDKAVFPGLQGGPHNHTTAGIAVAARGGAQPAFKRVRAADRRRTRRRSPRRSLERGFRLITGGTDNHLMLIDLTTKNVTGKVAAKALDRAGIVAQLQRDPVRSAQAVRSVRASHRDPGGHVPRHESGGDEAARRLDGRGGLRPGRRSARSARIAGEVKEMCKGFPAPGLRV